MLPTLSRAGRLCAWTGFVLVAAGAVRGLWSLAALGAILLGALAVAYLWFFPAAVLLRQRRLEMAWWVPTGAEPNGGDGGARGEGVGFGGALFAGRPFTLRVLLRNHAPRAFGDASLHAVGAPALAVAGAVRARVPAACEVEVTAEVTPLAAGTWHLHGAQLALGDRFGLFVINAYFPNPLACKVFPRFSAPSAIPALARRAAALHERAGQHRLRLRGLGGELREIRDHAHGDPFKQIAWKATARTRQLQVRELERDVVMTHQLLLDISPTMRGGEYGRAKLDYGIELCAAIARAAGDSGDRVGLTTFDSRIHYQVKAGDGRPHERRLLEHLMALRQVVDEDLTDPTDGELCALVARYLRHQEGIDVRLPAPPELDDPRWAEIATGPSGDLFDLDALDRVVTVFMNAARDPSAAALRVRASSPTMARLRRFCRLRGLEIPYRRGPGRKALGLAEALRLAARPRGSQLLLLVTDLEGLGDLLDGVLRAARLAITRHRLLVVAPFTPAFADVPDGDHARRVATILAQAERRALDGPRRALESLGVPVLVVGRDDHAQVVLRRWEHLRGGRRGGMAA